MAADAYSSAPSDAPFLRLSHVFKRYGSHVALRDVSLSVRGGDCVALLGANGAGKTTLLRIAATLSRPTRGEVHAFGVDAFKHRQQFRARLGVVAHQPYVYPELTCRENLRFFAIMYELRQADDAVERALERVELQARADDPATQLSRGLLQRLNIARAILHAPAVLILDEPDTGLDAAGRELLSHIVRAQRARGGVVLLTSHALPFALSVATRVAVVERGSIAFDGPATAVTEAALEQMIGHGRTALEAVR